MNNKFSFVKLNPDIENNLNLITPLKSKLDTLRGSNKGINEYSDIIIDITSVSSENLMSFYDIFESSIRSFDDNYYKILAYAIDINEDLQSISLFDHALVINKDITIKNFLDYLKNRLFIHEQKYLFDSSYRIIVCRKQYYTVDELKKMSHDDSSIKLINQRLDENIKMSSR